MREAEIWPLIKEMCMVGISASLLSTAASG